MTQTNELKTTLGRAWKLKTFLFTLALLVLAAWGAYDALIVYPNRGRVFAQFVLKQYLEAAEPAPQGDAPTKSGYWPIKTPAEMSIPDPPAEFARLKDLEEEGDLNRAGHEVERTRLAWLRALSRVESLGRLKRENDEELGRRAADPQSGPRPTTTLFVDLYKRYNDLSQELKNKRQPAELEFFDIPLQFAFMLTGLIGFVLMILFFVRVRRKVYRYDPVSKRLTLPGGVSFTPSDIEVVDKRKWDKFLVFVTLKDGSPEIRLDLYRYDPLEAWILEMEKLAPGYEVVVDEGESIMCVNVLTGQPIRIVPEATTTFPVFDEAGRASIYPAVQTVAGEWYIVGIGVRAHLRGAVDSGALDRSALKVDLGSFQVRMGEHDPENIPERDLRPSEDGEDEEPAPVGG